MRVIVDAMGGDKAPLEILKGAVAASREYDGEIILVGKEDVILSLAEQYKLDLSRFEIKNADSEITMEDDPLTVIGTKKDSSMMIGLNLLKEGYGDVFVSAGNTGALFAGATFVVKRAKGVKRAAIGTLLPAEVPFLLLDAGANISVADEHLVEFAVMGSAYMKKMFGLASPMVGLLNNGTEDSKGTRLQIDANKRLKQCKEINFVGNVEGSDALFGKCNVLVADGFTGNIYLKAMEGIGKFMLKSTKQVFMQGMLSRLAALMIKKPLMSMKRKFEPSTYGGSPLLGISKPVIKAHGSSDANAVKNAILEAVRYAQSGVTEDISAASQSYELQKNSI